MTVRPQALGVALGALHDVARLEDRLLQAEHLLALAPRLLGVELDAERGARASSRRGPRRSRRPSSPSRRSCGARRGSRTCCLSAGRARPMDAAMRRFGSFVSWRAMTQWTIWPGMMSFSPSLRLISRQCGGKMELTVTRLAFSIPASRSASSNDERRSLCTPTPFVKKMALGTNISCMTGKPLSPRTIRCSCSFLPSCASLRAPEYSDRPCRFRVKCGCVGAGAVLRGDLLRAASWRRLLRGLGGRRRLGGGSGLLLGRRGGFGPSRPWLRGAPCASPSTCTCRRGAGPATRRGAGGSPASFVRFSSSRIASMSFSRVPNFSFTSVKVACRRRSFAFETWARPLFLFVRATQRSSPVSFSTAATSLALSPNFSLTIGERGLGGHGGASFRGVREMTRAAKVGRGP